MSGNQGKFFLPFCCCWLIRVKQFSNSDTPRTPGPTQGSGLPVPNHRRRHLLRGRVGWVLVLGVSPSRPWPQTPLAGCGGSGRRRVSPHPRSPKPRGTYVLGTEGDVFRSLPPRVDDRTRPLPPGPPHPCPPLPDRPDSRDPTVSSTRPTGPYRLLSGGGDPRGARSRLRTCVNHDLVTGLSFLVPGAKGRTQEGRGGALPTGPTSDRRVTDPPGHRPLPSTGTVVTRDRTVEDTRSGGRREVVSVQEQQRLRTLVGPR